VFLKYQLSYCVEKIYFFGMCWKMLKKAFTKLWSETHNFLKLALIKNKFSVPIYIYIYSMWNITAPYIQIKKSPIHMYFRFGVHWTDFYHKVLWFEYENW